MATATKDEVKSFIQSEVAEVLKVEFGPKLTDLIKQNMETALEPLLNKKQADWATKLLGDGQKTQGEKPIREKGTAFARCLRATAAAKMLGSGPDGAIDILKRWGDHDLADEWAEGRRNAVKLADMIAQMDPRMKALAAGDALSGGFLVPPQFSTEVIELLRAVSVVRKMQARSIQMPTGTFKIPRLTTGATASYIGENQNIAKTEQRFGQLTLSFKKLAALTPISNDLLRYSSPTADTIVRDDVVQAHRVAEDGKFLRGDGTDGTPKGLLNWAVADHKVAANSTASVQNTFTDLGKIMQKLLDANIPMISPGWCFAPRIWMYLMTLLNTNGIPVFRDELLRGTLWGYPLGITTGIPTNLDTSGAGANNESEIYFTDFAQVIIGEALNLIVDASQEAAYHDGSAVQAAFSLDQTVIRAIQEHDFALRHEKAVAILTQVKWQPGSV